MKPKFIIYMKGGKSLGIQSYEARPEGIYYSTTDKPIKMKADNVTIDTSSCGFFPAISVEYVDQLSEEKKETKK